MKKIFLLDKFEKYENLNQDSWEDAAKKFFNDHTEYKCFRHRDFYVYGFDYNTNDYEVIRHFFSLIKKCDVLLVNLRDLDTSICLSDEILYAYMNDIPIIGFLETENILTEDEIINMVHPWKYLQINRIETGRRALQLAMDYIKTYY